MKKLLLLGLSLGMLVFGLAGIANADLFRDVKTQGVWLAAGNSASWTFNLDTDLLAAGDINPGDLIIPPSTLYITFSDDEADGGLNTYEFASLTTDGLPQFFNVLNEVNPGTESFTAGVWASIIGDHRLVVNIASTRGDFEVTNLELSGVYCDLTPSSTTSSVPEPATLMLLGSGLLGLGFFGRRKFRK
jgi:hypothetical protein